MFIGSFNNRNSSFYDGYHEYDRYEQPHHIPAYEGSPDPSFVGENDLILLAEHDTVHSCEGCDDAAGGDEQPIGLYGAWRGFKMMTSDAFAYATMTKQADSLDDDIEAGEAVSDDDGSMVRLEFYTIDSIEEGTDPVETSRNDDAISEEDSPLMGLSGAWIGLKAMASDACKFTGLASAGTAALRLTGIGEEWTNDALKVKKNIEAQKIHITAIVERMQKKGGDICSEDLASLSFHIANLAKCKNEAVINSETLKKTLVQLIKSRPLFAKTLLTILVVSLGKLVDDRTAVAIRLAIDPIMDQILPNAAMESQLNRVIVVLFEVLGLYLTSGTSAAVVCGGVAAFKEVAPKGMQKAAEFSAYAMLANKAGLPILPGIYIGLGLMLLLNNHALLREVTKDIKHTWKICQKSPLKMAPKIVFFVASNVKGNLTEVVCSVREGKGREAITRSATVALAVFGVYSGVGTLSLSFSLF